MNCLLPIGLALLLNYETVFCRKARKITDVSHDYYDYNTIPGVPGKDYPAYAEVPPNNFYCDEKMAGYYADPYYGCQVYHKCDIDGRRDSFLCTNGTIFNQEKFVCDWWYSVDCSQSRHFYKLNARLYKESYTPTAYTNEHRGASAHIYFAQRPHDFVSRLRPVDQSLYTDFLNFLRGYKKPSGQSTNILQEKPQEYESTEVKSPMTASSGEGSYETSQEEGSSGPAPVKVYKAQPVSQDGKAKVEPMSDH